jgi:hypothetical protein
MIVGATLLYTLLKNFVFPRFAKAGNTVLVTLHTVDTIEPTAVLAVVSRTLGRSAEFVSLSAHDGIRSCVLQVNVSDSAALGGMHTALKDLDANARFDVFFQDPRHGGY